MVVVEVTDLEDPTKGEHIELEMKANDRGPGNSHSGQGKRKRSSQRKLTVLTKLWRESHGRREYTGD